MSAINDLHPSVRDAMLAVEAAHFRTQKDTGSNPNAMTVWNALRRRLGLPTLTKEQLPDWPDHYAMPKDSALLANLLSKEQEARYADTSKIVDAACEVATFSKTHEWPAFASPEFFEFAKRLDALATAINTNYPGFNINIQKAKQP